MGPPVPRNRPLRAALVALQLVLPGAAAWSDALLDARGQAAPVHIESHSTPACARIHPSDCGLCHFLGLPQLGSARRDCVLPPGHGAVASPSGEALHASRREHYQPQPRAPPVLS